jgi:glucokinase
MPKICVIGVAGAVENNKVRVTNIPHWGTLNGEEIRQQFACIKSFEFLNDFAAAGLGVASIKDKDYCSVNKAEAIPQGVRIVTGPGTGFGQAYLVHSKFAPCYEVFPSEGGHVDFPARTKEDFELVDFARNYVENSNNIENLRGKAKT